MNTWTSPTSLSDALIERYGIDPAEAVEFKDALQRIKMALFCLGLSLATGATGIILDRICDVPRPVLGAIFVAMVAFSLLTVYIDTRVWKGLRGGEQA